MPRAKIPSPAPALTYYPVIINFGDDSTTWYQQVAAAIHAQPPEIRVQFVGGNVVAPYDIVSLRNCLLEVPSHIRLVTTAAASLPPFACAAWMTGDERRIAKDAVVWIPNLPEQLLRSGSKGPHGCLQKQQEDEDLQDDGFEDDDIPFGAPPVWESRNHRNESQNMGTARMEADIRILADIVNAWFPTWEYAGKFLRFDDLLEWGVVRPEWGFGGTRSRHALPAKVAQPSLPQQAPASAEAPIAQPPKSAKTAKPPKSSGPASGDPAAAPAVPPSPQPPAANNAAPADGAKKPPGAEAKSSRKRSKPAAKSDKQNPPQGNT